MIDSKRSGAAANQRPPRAGSATRATVELATLERVSWFSHQRLLESIGNIPPAEAEHRYRQQFAAVAAEPVLLMTNQPP